MAKKRTTTKRRKAPPAGKPIGSVRTKLARGLSRAKAQSACRKKFPGADWRGFTYDPSTGVATMT